MGPAVQHGERAAMCDRLLLPELSVLEDVVARVERLCHPPLENLCRAALFFRRPALQSVREPGAHVLRMLFTRDGLDIARRPHGVAARWLGLSLKCVAGHTEEQLKTTLATFPL